MGTRNLTMVVLNKEYRVAQYGQWDGDPGGTGLDILKFLRSVNLKGFKELVSKLRSVHENEYEDSFRLKQGKQNVPEEFTRDTGCGILDMISNRKTDRVHIDVDFAKDSLFCEWGYVIDLDTNKLEVYKGFNTKLLTEDDRFHFLPTNIEAKEYKPIIKVQEFDLDNLPSDEEFLSYFVEEDDE